MGLLSRPGLALAVVAALGAGGCLLDFRAGLACAGDSQCDGYLCRGGTCVAPGNVDGGLPLTLCCIAPGASAQVGFCTRPCVLGAGACPAAASGLALTCDADPSAACSPTGTFCQPVAGYAGWSQVQPSCTRDADCQGQAWP